MFQAVGFFRVESCPTQPVLPLVGVAAEKVIRDRHKSLAHEPAPMEPGRDWRFVTSSRDTQAGVWRR
ncbi:MAG: hypothetical protein ACQESR_14290 [Planctomycetota bacterium]